MKIDYPFENEALSYGKVKTVEIVYNGEACGIIEVTMSHALTSTEPLYSIVRITVFKNQPYITGDEVLVDSQLNLFYKDSCGAGNGVVLDLLLASPRILDTGLRLEVTEPEEFRRTGRKA